MMTSIRALLCFVLFAPAAANAQEARGQAGPLEPPETLGRFQLSDDLVIELVACEPEVIDPVAIRFDEFGRMWVVEMRDYPNGPAAGEKPLSKIKRLEDGDGDGRYETAATFAENLLFPTGLQPWKKGIIVTLSGRVAYFEDLDDDGRSDRVTDWFTGFAEENSQLRANHPTLAIDNHIYIANGLRGGEVRDARRADSPVVSISGRDFRFHPITNTYESVSGVGQFGMSFDDFGRRFICSNRNPLQHVVLEDRYLKQNPAVPISQVVHDVAAAAEQSKLYPISRTWTTSNLHANQFTAACGVLIYRGDALPDEYYGNGFTCEPTGNLVHREIIEPEGATFKSRPAAEGKEFLATTDEWFRPVNLETGPDGALYVVDMYRAVIEHPDWVPDELKHRPDERFGDDRGRIYRIRRKDAARESFKPFPDDTVTLVGQLYSRNSWRRETAARLLLERQDDRAVPVLRDLSRKAKFPATRAQALWLLHGLGAFNEDDFLSALTDPDPEVCEQALIISETTVPLAEVVRVKMFEPLIVLGGRFQARLNFQLVLSLAASQVPTDIEVRNTTIIRTAVHFPEDLWLRRAFTLGTDEEAGMVAADLLMFLPTMIGDKRAGPWIHDCFHAAGCIDANWKESRVRTIVSVLSSGKSKRPAWAALSGLLSAWDEHQVAWREEIQKKPELQKPIEDLILQANSILVDRSQELELRREAFAVAQYDLTRGGVREIALNDDDDQTLRLAAIEALAGSGDREFWLEILGRFPSESPPMRTAIVNAALGSEQSTAMLLDELESGRIKPQELARTDIDRLTRFSSDELQQRAAKILKSLTPEDREQALARYRPALALDGDELRGREIFSRACATCHKIGDTGIDVAPDISDSRTKTFEQLLGDIVQPNRAIDGNYISYVVQTTAGQTFTGIIAAETATSITLRQPEGKSMTLARDDIELLQSTGLSLMPEGLEQNLSLQDMADLLSFIKNWRYLDGQIPIDP